MAMPPGQGDHLSPSPAQPGPTLLSPPLPSPRVKARRRSSPWLGEHLCCAVLTAGKGRRPCPGSVDEGSSQETVVTGSDGGCSPAHPGEACLERWWLVPAFGEKKCSRRRDGEKAGGGMKAQRPALLFPTVRVGGNLGESFLHQWPPAGLFVLEFFPEHLISINTWSVVSGASGQGSLAGHQPPAARGASAGVGSAPPRAQEKCPPSGLGREGKLTPSFEGAQKDWPAETESSSTQPQDQSAEWQRDGLPLARRVL